METNVVMSLYDYLYILFDDYIVKSNKDFKTYKSIFRKKEFTEFVKNYSDIRKIPSFQVISNKDEIIDELIYAFKLLGKYVSGCDMFSKNEEVDDINTKYLKLLLIPHILGVLTYETINMNIRYDRLKDSKLYFNEYISIINIYKIILMDDYLLDEEENNDNAINRRNIKIRRAKDEKKYQEIYHEIVRTNLKKNTNQNYNEDDCTTDEDYRELYLSLIKYKCIQTLNMIDLIDIELQILEMRDREQKKKEELKNCSNDDNIIHTTNKNDSIKKPWLFTIKKNMQISDITQIRNYYKDLVFKPSHNLPTISLEECAKIEMEYALKGSNSANGNTNSKIKESKINGSKYNQVYSEDDEDGVKNDVNDEDYYKKCSKKEREKEIFDKEWDDWKDLHQKGIGNKNRNIA
ncbi:type 2A phosphatase-associated protein 42 [Plasmodium brasilianum]|uniref:Type 2A phosphatase-associated protein 42, putative n=2 Tax=Plasmodium (Plasmodium) TaxID=418103 RepID=A0A1A8VNM9_PLAMA|nr:type 2A phosphatase-associated protein 42, putative [Plasmodium malariae]KAI4840784.1 type 2A phosphatase-associated protein 42 [Plasmodium brasilianum]SBS82155.1 type 2A phosphatase-associated protein 42, putative (TAP42) [Plasmodium malariae]SBT86350.1 type 2A phosphatase-associated protein 42, putative [Plasmodium malariae]